MSAVNTQVYVSKMEEKMGGAAVVNHGRAESAAKEVLKKLARAQTDPYSQRNRTAICAFYLKGNCKRDKDCPFLHEMPQKKKKAMAGLQGDEAIVVAKPIPLVRKVPMNEMIVPLPPGSVVEKYILFHHRYPSQNSSILGTATRTFK